MQCIDNSVSIFYLGSRDSQAAGINEMSSGKYILRAPLPVI